MRLAERSRSTAGPIALALVVTLDRPKLGPLRGDIARSVAGLLGLPDTEVGVSFKTSEGLAPDHVQTRVTVLLGLREQGRGDD